MVLIDHAWVSEGFLIVSFLHIYAYLLRLVMNVSIDPLTLEMYHGGRACFSL